MIELKNICAGYEKKEVLHHINLTLQAGKVTVLLGPNGCGKSTLLKTLVRILPYQKGEILIEEKPIQMYSSSELAKKIAYLAQSKTIPDISVLRMVLQGRFCYLNYPRRYRKEDIEIAKQALQWAGLLEVQEENVNQLSGGMQQKVYIAMALAQNANTILMDEPTTYLDIAHQLRLMEMVKQLAKEGKAVVLVLHDISQALRIADTVVVLKDGIILLEGTSKEVYESGVLEEAFQVKIQRLQTEKGYYYMCESKGD